MPASDISRLSVSGLPRSDLAAQLAKDSAQRQIVQMIQNKTLNPNDSVTITKEYKTIYSLEYYKFYAILMQQDQQSRIIYVPTENPKKYYCRHTVVNFSKLNCFVHVHRGCITVSKVNFPLNEEISLETKEAFLDEWPGPLDRPDEHVKHKASSYVDTLWQHDCQRRIRYTVGYNDDHRKVILRLLAELLHRNGTIDAPCITRLLLKQDQTEIQKDESYRKPLETLQKYLLLGKRGEAIKFARSKKLWDHAQCLAFLDKYQPPQTDNYVKDGSKLQDDSIVQLNHEYISSIESNILNTVYRSLLNRILQNDPDAVNIIKRPNVNNNEYEFAILCANDCEMEFDQTNEIFKLIMAVKQAITNPAVANRHLISLGMACMDGQDADESFCRSSISFKQSDTFASRTLTITNIDMLLLNELWEYTLNLGRNTTNPSLYEYLPNLVPYKLIFASRLLDYGMYEMFAGYLSSMENALLKLKSQPHLERDPYYDWETIEDGVRHLSNIWTIYRSSPGFIKFATVSSQFESQSNYTGVDAIPPPSFGGATSASQPISYQHDYNSPLHNDPYPSMPYQGQEPPSYQMNYASQPQQAPHSVGASSHTTRQSSHQQQHHDQFAHIPTPMFGAPISEETTDFNPESEPQPGDDMNAYEAQHHHHNSVQQQHSADYPDYSNTNSRRASAIHQSMDVPVFSPPPAQFGMQDRAAAPPQLASAKGMQSSSPVNKRDSRDSSMMHHSNPLMADSFNNPISPINEYDDYRSQQPPTDSEPLSQPPPPPPSSSQNNHRTSAGESASPRNRTNSGSGDQPAGGSSKSQQGSLQPQTSFLGQLVGSAKALLPKSNSKQMILPDDSSKSIVYDDKTGAWVDTTAPESQADSNGADAPPILGVPKPPTNYSFAVKSSKSRYPKAQF